MGRKEFGGTEQTEHLSPQQVERPQESPTGGALVEAQNFQTTKRIVCAQKGVLRSPGDMLQTLKDILENAVSKAAHHPHILPTKYLNVRKFWLPSDF